MKHCTFAQRLAYARWLYLARTGQYVGNADLGRAVERTGPWATKWSAADEPPTDYRVHTPLAQFLGMPEQWLIRGEGDPPQPELWALWRAEQGDTSALTAMKEALCHPRPATDADLPRHRRPPKPPPDDPDEDAARPKRPRRRRA